MKEGKKSKFGPTGPWFRMPRELTLSSELNPYQYRMLSILVERDDFHQSTKNKDRFWSFTEWLVSHSGMGRTKAKKTLNELEAMGFITITRNKTKHLANIFHINWDFINGYKAPKTGDDELEELEGADAQNDTASVATTTLDEFDTDMSVEEERRKYQEPEMVDTTTPTLPTAAEWYVSYGKNYLRSQEFPYLYELTLDRTSALNAEIFEERVSQMMDWVLHYVSDDNGLSVWNNVIMPDFMDYCKEQKNQNNERTI